MPRPWAILFDLDGTLVDTTAFLLQSMRHAFEIYPGRHPTDPEWVAGIGTPLRTQLRQFIADEAQVEAVVARYRAYQKLHHDALTFAFDGAVELARHLKKRGHPTAIVTSKGDDLAHRTLKHVGLAPFMDVVMTAENVTHAKPHPEPVLLALQKLERTPREAVFVGDSPHDITAGGAAGVVTIAAMWGPFPPGVLAAANPTHQARTLGELRGLLDAIGVAGVD